MKALKYLMGAYFHQDYDMDGGTSADTVRSFTHERTDLVQSCVADIDALLAQSLPEGELRSTLHGWGCDYYPGDSDQAHRDWLSAVRAQLTEHLRHVDDGSTSS